MQSALQFLFKTIAPSNQVQVVLLFLLLTVTPAFAQNETDYSNLTREQKTDLLVQKKMDSLGAGHTPDQLRDAEARERARLNKQPVAKFDSNFGQQINTKSQPTTTPGQGTYGTGSRRQSTTQNEPANSKPSNLLAEIQKGKELKKIQTSEKPKPATAANPLLQALGQKAEAVRGQENSRSSQSNQSHSTTTDSEWDDDAPKKSAPAEKPPAGISKPDSSTAIQNNSPKIQQPTPGAGNVVKPTPPTVSKPADLKPDTHLQDQLAKRRAAMNNSDSDDDWDGPPKKPSATQKTDAPGKLGGDRLNEMESKFTPRQQPPDSSSSKSAPPTAAVVKPTDTMTVKLPKDMPKVPNYPAPILNRSAVLNNVGSAVNSSAPTNPTVPVSNSPAPIGASTSKSQLAPPPLPPKPNFLATANSTPDRAPKSATPPQIPEKPLSLRAAPIQPPPIAKPVPQNYDPHTDPRFAVNKTVSMPPEKGNGATGTIVGKTPVGNLLVETTNNKGVTTTKTLHPMELDGFNGSKVAPPNTTSAAPNGLVKGEVGRINQLNQSTGNPGLDKLSAGVNKLTATSSVTPPSVTPQSVTPPIPLPDKPVTATTIPSAPPPPPINAAGTPALPPPPPGGTTATATATANPPPPVLPPSSTAGKMPTDLKNQISSFDNKTLKPVTPESQNAYAQSKGLTSAQGITPGDGQVGAKTAPPTLTSSDNALANAAVADGKYRGIQANAKNTDQCNISAGIKDQYACSGTVSTMQGVQMGNQMAMMTGSLATQGMGAAAQASAMSATNQKEQMQAAADLQIATGATQTSLGMGIMAAGGVLTYLGGKHNRNTTAIAKLNAGNIVVDKNGVVTGGDGDTGEAITRFGLVGQTLESATGHLDDIKRQATSEQKGVAQQAKMAGFMTMMQGMQQASAGGVAIGAGAMMREAANKFAAPVTNIPINPIMPGADMNSTGITGGGGGSNTITGDGANPIAAAAQAEELKDLGPPSLGTGFDPNPVPAGLGPEGGAGAFNLGAAPPGGGGGGGGGDFGGGETAAAEGQQEQGAMVAENPEAQSYATGGAFSGGGGGGNGKGGAEGGPDLSGLLAAFLPKKDDAAPTNGIMDFGGKSPGMGGEDGPPSMFDRNVNIFERVHETYQDKHKHGAL